jgi:hypothetical protein
MLFPAPALGVAGFAAPDPSAIVNRSSKPPPLDFAAVADAGVDTEPGRACVEGERACVCACIDMGDIMPDAGDIGAEPGDIAPNPPMPMPIPTDCRFIPGGCCVCWNPPNGA